jgi:O-antigen/teichoic acid export membrane protein
MAAGWLGAGVWALILFRVVVVFVQSLALVLMMRLDIRPSWSRRHFDELSHFAWFTLWGRLTDNLTYLVFNYMISDVFGLSELGRFNMALRVIEPVRGALIAIAHNLNFSHFQPVARTPALLSERALGACARLTLLCAPAFFGMAAVAPLLIPALAGQGWEESIAITQVLAVGSGCMLATSPVQTALAASGRPQYGLYANLYRLAAICLGIFAGAGFGAVGIGFARTMGDASDIVINLLVAHRRMDLRLGALLAALFRPLVLSALMGMAVAWAGPHLLPFMRPVAALAVSVAFGVLLYGALVAVFAPGMTRRLLQSATGGRLSAAA